MHAHSAVRGRTDFNTPIRIDGLTKCFGSIVAVDQLNLTVAPDEVFGFLGPNGAGKSTTIRVTLGLLRPSAGTAQIFGVAAGDEILELPGSTGPGVDTEYRAELVDRFELDVDRPGKAYSSRTSSCKNPFRPAYGARRPERTVVGC